MTIADKILKNTLFNAGGNVYNALLQLIIIPFMVLKLGTERFGIWALVSVIFGLYTAFDFGIGAAFVKYFSEYYTKKDYKSFNRVLIAGFLFMFIFSVFSTLLILLFREKMINFFNIPLALQDEAGFVFIGAAIIFGFNNTFIVFQAIIKGLQRMEITNLINVVAATLFIIMVFVVLNSGFGLKGLIFAQGLKILVVSLFSIYFSKRIFNRISFKFSYFHFQQVKELLSYGIKMQISNIANLINLQTDKTIIGYFLSLTYVATYEIGQKIFLFCRMIVSMALSALVPAVSELDAAGKKDTILKLYEKGNKYIVSFAFPILIFIITFANLFIHLWMGKGYEGAALVARLLVIGIGINMLTGVGVMIVRGVGKPFYETEYALISLILNIILGIILVKSYGFFGVVAATPISVSIGSLFFIYRFHRLYDISLLRLMTKVFFKPFIVSVILSISIYLLNLLIHNRLLITTRIETLFLILFDMILFFPLFIIVLKRINYWDQEDKLLIQTKADRYPLVGRLLAHSI